MLIFFSYIQKYIHFRLASASNYAHYVRLWQLFTEQSANRCVAEGTHSEAKFKDSFPCNIPAGKDTFARSMWKGSRGSGWVPAPQRRWPRRTWRGRGQPSTHSCRKPADPRRTASPGKRQPARHGEFRKPFRMFHPPPTPNLVLRSTVKVVWRIRFQSRISPE